MNVKLRKFAMVATVLAAATMGAAAVAQGPGYGPGMTGGGPGYGPGMMGGGGPGYGPGYGPGMRGGGPGFGPGYGPGRGFGPGQGRGYGPGAGLIDSLDLTDEQREKILSIREENRQKNWTAMGQLRAEMFALRRMYYADKVDANAVVEQQKKVDELRRALLKSRLESRNQVEALLTPEQRRQFREVRPRWLPDAEQ